jgi:hypothetical protein
MDCTVVALCGLVESNLPGRGGTNVIPPGIVVVIVVVVVVVVVVVTTITQYKQRG